MANKAALADHLRTISLEEMSRSELMHYLADRTPSMFRGKPSYVYFIGCPDGEIKIGLSTCVEARLREIKRECAFGITVLAQRRGGIERERAYHEAFSSHRKHGEWFHPHPDILAEIERLNADTSHDHP